MGEKSVKRHIAVIAVLFLVFVGGVVWVGEDIRRMQIFLGILAGAITVSAGFFFLWSRGQGAAVLPHRRRDRRVRAGIVHAVGPGPVINHCRAACIPPLILRI